VRKIARSEARMFIPVNFSETKPADYIRD